MNRISNYKLMLACGLSACLAIGRAMPVTAQGPSAASPPPGFQTRPRVSPYLNLLRSDNPVLNYHGIVRPELQLRANEAQLRSNLGRLESQFNRYRTNAAERTGSNLTSSGHQVQFMSNLRGERWSINRDGQMRSLQWKVSPDGRTEQIPSTGHTSFFGNNSSFFARQMGGR